MNIKNKYRPFAHAALVSMLVFGANTAFAQAAGRGPVDCPCPIPVKVHISKSALGTNADASDFPPIAVKRLNEASYNATQVNKMFTETFKWEKPKGRVCEVKGSVTIKLKNLGEIASNDSVGLFENGKGLPGFSQGGTGGALWQGTKPGAIKTVTFNLTSAMVQRGQLSILVQDDTAVQEVKLDITGCCITPN